MAQNVYDVSAVPNGTTVTVTDDAINDNDWAVILSQSGGTAYLSFQNAGEPTSASIWGMVDNFNRWLKVTGAVENAVGTDFRDIIGGNNLDNILLGDDDRTDLGADQNGGDDDIDAFGGDDFCFGGAGIDLINGGTGDDTLAGGLGYDVLVGDTGKDIFLFTGALNKSYDEIWDYDVKEDSIQLDNEFFVGLKVGDLAKSAFEANKSGKADDSRDRIIYETDTGKLFFDQDGKGGKAGVYFALLDPPEKLSHKEFEVVAGWDISG